MSETHVITVLVAKRLGLSGLVAHYMQEIKCMDVDLHHIEPPSSSSIKTTIFEPLKSSSTARLHCMESGTPTHNLRC